MFAISHDTIRSCIFTLVRIGLLMAVGLLPLRAGADDAENTDTPAAAPTADDRTVDIEFSSQGQMRVVLEIEHLELESPYGKLSIPVKDIRRLIPATRIDAPTQARINKAIENLGSSEFTLREAASKELSALAEKAYPALAKASKHADPEVARHARELIEKLRLALPEEKLELREFDVVETPHSTISGRIVAQSLAVKTAPFGKQTLQLTDVRSLRSVLEPVEKEEALPVEPDPGNLTRLHSAIGKKFAFRVTGRADGFVFGTGVYTTDSSLATAAVHCGALKPGETGVVRVSMIASPGTFISTTQNGVTSHPWGPYPAAYQVHVPKKKK